MTRITTKLYFIRKRGFTYLEIITTDVRHQMFKEDVPLRSKREQILTYIRDRANPIAKRAFPEWETYARSKILNLNLSDVFKNWICLRKAWTFAGHAPLGEPCSTWDEWIKTPGMPSTKCHTPCTHRCNAQALYVSTQPPCNHPGPDSESENWKKGISISNRDLTSLISICE